jgi:LmbE family N-acetylglucosaminyl deacetylase
MEISRRALLLAAGSALPAAAQPRPARTVLAIGAHYDDCVFGIPGILLQAVRKRCRVINLTLIGDYTSWPPIAGRARELLEGSTQLAKEHGVEMRFLDFKSHQFDVDRETKRKVARAVAEIKPDIAFYLWPEDNHEDHKVASRLSSIALRGAGSVLDDASYRPPRQIYTYDNGPRHTIGFQPDTYVDISADWERAIDWLGRLMALVRNKPYDAARHDGAQSLKEALASYRGKSCGVAYAEALQAMNRSPREIL